MKRFHIVPRPEGGPVIYASTGLSFCDLQNRAIVFSDMQQNDDKYFNSIEYSYFVMGISHRTAS